MNYRFDKKEHLHFLDDRPLTGTSSVENVLSKPLTWWASGLAVSKFGWLNPKKHTSEECAVAVEEAFERIKNLERDDYAKLLDEAYRAHSVNLKDTAQEGVDLHAELEKWIKYRMGIIKTSGKIDKKINPFILWAEDNVKKFLWSEAHCFDEDLWVGGISDAGAELMDGTYAVIDFKRSKEAYPNHFIQAAGYAIQIDKNGLWDNEGKRNKVLDKKISSLIVIPFGSEKFEPVVRNNIEDFKKGFVNCVSLYRLLGLENNK